MQNLVVIIIMFIAVIGPSIVIAIVGAATVKALGRNPSAAPKIYLGVILMLVFAEAASIISLLVVFQIFVPRT
ncbi:MAG TPA: ATP synthase F0 subunit C [Candidatus Omnitrophota bacterium]|nr:ATP synthase F0 subunit C [Candidatus Omnitrophota bacterium]